MLLEQESFKLGRPAKLLELHCKSCILLDLLRTFLPYIPAVGIEQSSSGVGNPYVLVRDPTPFEGLPFFLHDADGGSNEFVADWVVAPKLSSVPRFARGAIVEAATALTEAGWVRDVVWETRLHALTGLFTAQRPFVLRNPHATHETTCPVTLLRQWGVWNCSLTTNSDVHATARRNGGLTSVYGCSRGVRGDFVWATLGCAGKFRSEGREVSCSSVSRYMECPLPLVRRCSAGMPCVEERFRVGRSVGRLGASGPMSLQAGGIRVPLVTGPNCASVPAEVRGLEGVLTRGRCMVAPGGDGESDIMAALTPDPTQTAVLDLLDPLVPTENVVWEDGILATVYFKLFRLLVVAPSVASAEIPTLFAEWNIFVMLPRERSSAHRGLAEMLARRLPAHTSDLCRKAQEAPEYAETILAKGSPQELLCPVWTGESVGVKAIAQGSFIFEPTVLGQYLYRISYLADSKRMRALE